MNPGALPRDVYTERLAGRQVHLKRLEGQRLRLGNVRLLVFLGVAAACWLAWQGRVSPWWILAPLVCFIALVWQQSRIERAAEFVRRGIRFYESGLARIENRWQAADESGERFLDPHHPYAADLDIFGRGSLFQLLSTARTRGGEAMLANWLRWPAALDELRQRHEAVDELRPLLDLREQLAVLGDDYRTGVHPEHLIAWAETPARPFPRWLRLLALALSLVQAFFLVWWFATQFTGIQPEICVLVTGMVEGAVALTLRNRILASLYSVHAPAHDLDLLSQILAVLEQQDFRSPRLAALRDAIRVKGKPASSHIARLRRWMELLDSRDNVFVRIFGPPLLWGTQIAMAVENWRAEQGPVVRGWLDAVSEMEALSCLANYAWEHPADPWPVFQEERIFHGEELGHPLLADARCVRNSVALTAPLRLMVVSGSNMSGKSTLLRAVGINAVLALAGAPVRAKRLVISRLSVGASIRTMDSLEEGHSRFMAEILRLKQILELPPPALFLLDELLHGTNSHDRAIGAEGLLHGLLERGAIGIATTHDLSLARVADQLIPAAANVHFEDRLENGRLVFDYRMRPGVVARSNALDLMRAVGLNV
ncbi:MAG: DNA mismatch repair protein MutS [Acidobacteriota bacterium]